MSPWSPCSLLLIMFWVSSCVETARFDAIVVLESMVVDGMMPGLYCLILGFGITYVRSSGNIKVQKMSVRIQNNLQRPQMKLPQERLKQYQSPG